jgi:indole-3-glycerol phosphate synthase / phosphoribosylanthranilate isomerase
MDFLSKILAARRERVKAAKASAPIEQVRVRAETVRGDSIPHRFAKALRDENQTNIIAEFKRRSPSKGDLNTHADAAVVAKAYESGGAAAISVLTEEDFFGGSLADLKKIRETVSIPLLRKDFIVDEYQVCESAAAGADAFLLIVAALDDSTLARLRALGEDELGMDALVEVHTKDELNRAVNAGARIIGANNRNLHTFEVSIDTSEQLARIAPRDAILVSESGLSPAAITLLIALGYRGFLVGEALMRAEDPAEALRDFIAGQTGSRAVQVKICGITNLQDARAAIEAGADMLGFNFFQQSPRFVDPETARRIIQEIRPKSNGPVTMVGVFVNETIENVLRIAETVNLDGIQLHGDETAEFCERLKRLSPQRLLIKAMTTSGALDLNGLSDYQVDLIMIDAYDPKLRGGTGQTADWAIARDAAANLPGIVLAGGLSAENVAAAIAMVRPRAVDACSSLETSPGRKNAERMREFVNAVRTSKLPAEPAHPMS